MATSVNYKRKFGQKVSFTKMIFTFKIVFHKDDFESVNFSNKHNKSHVWPKNLKKKKKKKRRRRRRRSIF